MNTIDLFKIFVLFFQFSVAKLFSTTETANFIILLIYCLIQVLLIHALIH